MLLALAACGEKAAEAPAETAAPAEPAPAPAAPAPAPAALTLADLPAPWNAADLEEGKSQFMKCRNCHSLIEKDGNLVGPNLHGVFTRHPGTAPKFRYSDALKSIALERWTPEELDKWLSDPKGYLPGSSMFFNGIDDPEARRDIIAYLMTAS